MFVFLSFFLSFLIPKKESFSFFFVELVVDGHKWSCPMGGDSRAPPLKPIAIFDFGRSECRRSPPSLTSTPLRPVSARLPSSFCCSFSFLKPSLVPCVAWRHLLFLFCPTSARVEIGNYPVSLGFTWFYLVLPGFT